MTAEEAKAVKDYIKSIQGRIMQAKDAIDHWNFGEAHAILSEPFPRQNFNLKPDNE